MVILTLLAGVSLFGSLFSFLVAAMLVDNSWLLLSGLGLALAWLFAGMGE